MAESELTVTITGQDVRVNDPENSKVSIEIKNDTGADVRRLLFVTLPPAIQDVVFSPEAYEADDAGTTDEGATWRIGGFRGETLRAGTFMRVELSRINATAAGPLTIDVEWYELPKKKVGSVSLEITVLAADAVPRIHSFEAEEYVVTWRGIRRPITLRCHTDEESDVELTCLGRVVPKRQAAQPPDWTHEWEDNDYDGPGVQPYQLTATAKGRTVTRWLFVRVQQSGAWSRIECRQGTPTLLLNDSDNTMYGVFIEGDAEADSRSAAVYRLDPARGAMGERDERCCPVPDGMEQSPGVFFGNKIWLIGGSQIDPDVCSNLVWCFDPLAETEETKTPNPPWTPRMGHACAVFKDRIWLLGGADANGRALKEVWSWSGKDGEAWTPHPEPAVWTATTLLSAAADESRLYVYGGADEPFGTPHTGLYCTEDGETWSVAELRGDAAGTGDLGYGQPFGSGLCVTRAGKSRHLRILGTYRPHATSSTFGPVALKYDRGGLTRFDEGLDEEGNGWTTRREGDGWQPFRLSAIGFRSSIFVASVLYKTNSPSLTYYVAGDPT